MNRHDAELLDTIEAEYLKHNPRKPRVPREQSRRAVNGQVKIADATYLRVRAACCEFSSLDLDEHAALVTLDVLNARAVPRFLP